MKITIQINKYSILYVPVANIQEAHFIFKETEMQSLMKNPTSLTTFLELNEPSFSALTLEYFATEDSVKYKEALRAFQVPLQTFQKYLAHCFEIPTEYISIEQ